MCKPSPVWFLVFFSLKEMTLLSHSLAALNYAGGCALLGSYLCIFQMAEALCLNMPQAVTNNDLLRDTVCCLFTVGEKGLKELLKRLSIDLWDLSKVLNCMIN